MKSISRKLLKKEYNDTFKAIVTLEKIQEDVKKVSASLENGCKKDAPGSFINWLYDKSVVHAFEMPGQRYDIGNLESYKLVNETYNGIKLKSKDKKIVLK